MCEEVISMESVLAYYNLDINLFLFSNNHYFKLDLKDLFFKLKITNSVQFPLPLGRGVGVRAKVS